MKTEAAMETASALTAADKARVDQYRVQHRAYEQSKARLVAMKARRSELNAFIGRLEQQAQNEEAAGQRAIEGYATGSVESDELERTKKAAAITAHTIENHRAMVKSLESEIEAASKALDRERHLVGQARNGVLRLIEAAAFMARCGEFDIPLTLE